MPNTEALRRTSNFIDFVEQVKIMFPKKSEIFISGSPFEEVASIWNKLGQDYLHMETVDAMAATMYLLQKNGIDQVGSGQTNWLSMGSGPGLYEMYLSKQLNRVQIDNLDISIQQLNASKFITNSLADKSTERIRTLNASMDAIPVASDYYNRILILNSLHWCASWGKAISEIGRVLNKKTGRVYAVLGSASILTNEGKTRLNQDLNSYSLIDCFEHNGFVTKHIVQMGILNGQHGLSTERLFGIFERGVAPSKNWADRILSRQIRLDELTILSNGIIKERRLNP